MKTVLAAAAASLALLATPALAADPIEGIWQTQADDGAFAFVEITPCGAAFCGTITRTFNAQGEYASPNIGKQLVMGMVPQGGGRYEGKVWRPSNDKIYLGKVDIDGDRMRLRGCVAGGLFCASQTWVKLR